MHEPQQPSLDALVEGKPAQEKPPLVAGTPAYLEAVKRTRSTWIAMRYRCRDSRCNGYHNYGGRGISVCDRWNTSFENFLEDMGFRPAGTEIDRINVNGNYEPGNCRWIPRALNARTRRSNQIPFIDGETARDRKAKVHRLWVSKNRKKRKAQLQRWAIKNRDRIRSNHRAWVSKNREHRNSYARERFRNSPEVQAKAKAYNSEWLKKNADSVVKKRAEYYARNREALNAKSRAYYAANRERLCQAELERYHKRKAAAMNKTS